LSRRLTPPSDQTPGGQGNTSGGSGAPPSGPSSRLDRAAQVWLKKGYSARYRDPYLIQVMKRYRSDLWQVLLGFGFGVSAVVLLVALVRRLLRVRWHVVELTQTPDERIITHQLWAPRPPDD